MRNAAASREGVHPRGAHARTAHSSMPLSAWTTAVPVPCPKKDAYIARLGGTYTYIHVPPFDVETRFGRRAVDVWECRHHVATCFEHLARATKGHSNRQQSIIISVFGTTDEQRGMQMLVGLLHSCWTLGIEGSAAGSASQPTLSWKHACLRKRR